MPCIAPVTDIPTAEPAAALILSKFASTSSLLLQSVIVLIEFGPVTALLTIIIGGPLVSYVLRIVKRLMSKYDYVDSGVENFLYRIISTALWLYVVLVAANALGINVTGIIAA